MSIVTPEQQLEKIPSAVLRARFEVRDGVTRLADKYHTAPIKIAKTFPLVQQLGVMMMDVSPGLLSGDYYDINWYAEEKTSVFLTNQSFTKVHPAEPGQSARMRQQFLVKADALVENMMEPVMLYEQAEFCNETLVRLEPGAVWMQAEVLCPGRISRGEAFQYRCLDNRLQVFHEEQLIFAQRQYVEPLKHRMKMPGAWEGWSHLGSFYCFSDRITSLHVEKIREALSGQPAREGNTLRIGVSLTFRHGLAVSVAGMSAWQVQEALHTAWSVMRSCLLDLSELKFRK